MISTSDENLNMIANEDLFEQLFTERLMISLNSLLNEGQREISVDCSECRMMSGYTVGRLIAFSKTLSKEGGKLKLVKVQNELKEILTIMKLNEIIDIS